MTATRQDITIYQGTDYTEPFILSRESGSLTNATAAMQIRKTVGDATALLTLTTWDNTLDIDPVSRTATPIISETTSAALPAGQCVYDLKLTDSDGYTSITHQGYVNVRGLVTTVPFPAPAPSPAPSPSPSPSPAEYTNADGVAYTNADGTPYTATP